MSVYLVRYMSNHAIVGSNMAFANFDAAMHYVNYYGLGYGSKVYISRLDVWTLSETQHVYPIIEHSE